MNDSFEYKGLTLTPTDLAFSDEELHKLLTFEGAITHERLKGFDFHYYLMPEYDLNGLLEKLGDAERKASYWITSPACRTAMLFALGVGAVRK